MSSSRKVQNNSQSRFSFARQEETRNRAFDVDTSFSAFGQVPNHQSFGHDFADNRNTFLDKLGLGNGFSSSNFEESETFASSPLFPSIKPSGNHLLDSSSLLRNSYQAPPTGNIAGDIEFMDPAILAVGKGRLQGGLNNPGLDIRSNFQEQLSAFENEARLQLLKQRSLSSHQNLRYPDIGDIFALGDNYCISSRLMDQPQVNNLSPFAQLSLQQSRNGLMSNGHWDGWNDFQGETVLAW